jgi:GTPase-associated protein 1, N-terminal domain type 2/GTPase-associated protein 1, middle domain
LTQELIYTSAPHGLKPGARGVCSVVATRGMAEPLIEFLESVSVYRPLYRVDDPRAASNPVSLVHLRVSLGGKNYSVLSRIADYGLDYSQRTNKLAHHVVLEPSERSSAGPAWVVSQPGFMESRWDGKTRWLDSGRPVPAGTEPSAPCSVWAEVTGDAGWAGVLAENWLAGGTSYLVFDLGTDVLRLIREALVLMPAERRWEATFSTYYTGLPTGVPCACRCVLKGSLEADQAARLPNALVINLTQRSAAPHGGAMINNARTGPPVKLPPVRKQEPAVRKEEPVAAAAASKAAEPADRNPQPAVAEANAAAISRPPRSSHERTRASVPPTQPETAADATTRRSRRGWLIVAAAMLLFALMSGGTALILSIKSQPPINKIVDKENTPPPKDADQPQSRKKAVVAPVPATRQGAPPIVSQPSFTPPPASSTSSRPPDNHAGRERIPAQRVLVPPNATAQQSREKPQGSAGSEQAQPTVNNTSAASHPALPVVKDAPNGSGGPDAPPSGHGAKSDSTPRQGAAAKPSEATATTANQATRPPAKITVLDPGPPDSIRIATRQRPASPLGAGNLGANTLPALTSPGNAEKNDKQGTLIAKRTVNPPQLKTKEESESFLSIPLDLKPKAPFPLCKIEGLPTETLLSLSLFRPVDNKFGLVVTANKNSVTIEKDAKPPLRIADIGFDKESKGIHISVERTGREAQSALRYCLFSIEGSQSEQYAKRFRFFEPVTEPSAITRVTENTSRGWRISAPAGFLASSAPALLADSLTILMGQDAFRFNPISGDHNEKNRKLPVALESSELNKTLKSLAGHEGDKSWAKLQVHVAESKPPLTGAIVSLIHDREVITLLAHLGKVHEERYISLCVDFKCPSESDEQAKLRRNLAKPFKPLRSARVSELERLNSLRMLLRKNMSDLSNLIKNSLADKGRRDLLSTEVRLTSILHQIEQLQTDVNGTEKLQKVLTDPTDVKAMSLVGIQLYYEVCNEARYQQKLYVISIEPSEDIPGAAPKAGRKGS